MKTKNVRLIYMASGMIVTTLMLGGCQKIPVIEKADGSQVIQQEFTQSAKALTNELNDFNEIEELYIEDEEDTYLDLQVRTYLNEDPEIKNHRLNLETMDLKLFVGENGDTYFIALMMDHKENPNTLFGKLKLIESGKYTVEYEHLASYMVNMPKTYLLEKDGVLVILSQRPFSTFEECYFFKVDSGKLVLFQRGWQDPSLLYYSAVTTYLEQGNIEAAMNTPDESMYPMGYERELFETANLMVRTAEEQAVLKEKANEEELAIVYLEWALSYYFQNHYGEDVAMLIQDGFKPILEGTKDDFGGAYLLEKRELKRILIHYANLLGKIGREKEAENLKKALEESFQ